jgi:hypothetical protein
MECPEWFPSIIPTNVEESRQYTHYCDCCSNETFNTCYFTYCKHINSDILCVSDFCLKCVNNNLKELYENNYLKEECTGVCRLCYKSECTCDDPVIGVQFVKDHYKYIDTSKYKSYYITDYFSNVVNIEKPKILIPVHQLSDVFHNTYIKIDMDFLIYADINHSSILDLVSITYQNPSLTERFTGYFLINANPESKDYKRIAISIHNIDYRSIILYIDEDLETFTYKYQEYLKENKKWYLEPEFKDFYDELIDNSAEDKSDVDEYFKDYSIYYIMTRKLTYNFSTL